MKDPILWYDKQGKPLTTVSYDENPEKWRKEMDVVNKLLSDRKYKIIKQEYLWWGGWLSTVWLGLDHGFSILPGSHPMIFESMLFAPWTWNELTMDRYPSEVLAKIGHDELKKEWSNPLKIIRPLLRHYSYRFEYVKFWFKKVFICSWKGHNIKPGITQKYCTRCFKMPALSDLAADIKKQNKWRLTKVIINSILNLWKKEKKPSS